MRSVSADTYLGIDIGGSALKYGWGNVSTGLVFSDKIFLRSNTLAAMKQAAFQILDKAEQAIGLECISAIGIGSPGTINSKTGRLMGVNPNLPEWSDILPSEIIPAQIGKPCYCDNDANLMTLAEANLLREKTHVIGITIGSGIGCGLVVDGCIYHGATGFAMEAGHTIMIPDGAVCNCGRRGCLEAYTSVNGIVNQLTILKPDLKISNMQDVLHHCKTDSQVSQVFQVSLEMLAQAFANMIVTLDADALVIGGGVVEICEYPTTLIIKKTLDLLPEVNKLNLIIKKAELGNLAGTYGAIILAEKSYLSAFGNEICTINQYL